MPGVLVACAASGLLGIFVKPIAFFSFLFALLSGVPAVWAQDVVIFTEEYPPFNFTKENGEIDGISTRLVQRLMGETGLSYEIKTVSWSHAMNSAERLDNALIYSVVYSEERAAQYEWLVPLSVTQLFLYGRKDLPLPIKREDFGAGKYSAVCPLKSFQCTMLETLGFQRDNIHRISFVDSVEQYKMVATGKADFFLTEPMTNAYFFDYGDLPYSKDTFKRVLSVGTKMQAFLAAGKQMRPELKQKIWQTFERMIAGGSFTPITSEMTEQSLRALLK